jgi:hypothetical protein
MKTNTKIRDGSQRNDLMLHLKFLGKQEQAKPKINRGEKRAELNETETKNIQKNQ